jgi:hypothetical protein
MLDGVTHALAELSGRELSGIHLLEHDASGFNV